MEILTHTFKHGLLITVFVFVMMLLVDYCNVLTKGRMSQLVKGGLFRQYLISSFLGSTPGCLGAFLNVTFYLQGLISFGALAGGMIATSGDEAFVMLALFPKTALLLFGILFVTGIVSAVIIDKVVKIFNITTCSECSLSGIHLQEDCRCLNGREVIAHIRKISFARFLLFFLLAGTVVTFIAGILGPQVWNWKRVTFISLVLIACFVVLTVPDHYLEDHIWEHIIKRHLLRVFLWSFGTLLLVDIGLQFWNLEAFVKAHMFWVLLIAVLVAIVPESGPHLIFVMMFTHGIVPFSVLLANSIVQDGHGMLPLLSYTVKDSILIKLVNLVIGATVGIVLYTLGF